MVYCNVCQMESDGIVPQNVLNRRRKLPRQMSLGSPHAMCPF